jgi:GNAT superfamily N-acetyltransferase
MGQLLEGLVIREEPIGDLRGYEHVSIAFEAKRMLEVLTVDGGLGGLIFQERQVEPPLRKDYDSIPGHSPLEWSKRFDLSRWGLIGARLNGERIGGAVIAFNTPEVAMLEGRHDLAILWDIRVAPENRRHGVGSALFRAAESWALVRGCRQIKTETQNINVDANKFYARQGWCLGVVNRFAYEDYPDEIQLLWFKDLVVGV